MKIGLSSALTAYRDYRRAVAKNRAYRFTRYAFFGFVLAYLLLLSFPQVLFAHQISYKNFRVYSREPLGQDAFAVLDRVETRLAQSEIYNTDVKPKIFLVNSHGLYSLLSLHLGGNSFGKGFALLPTANVFINKADLARDLVFRKAQENTSRSLSGVVSHEITHLLIRKRFGYWRNLTIPSWKKEGYCEYVSGGSTLSYDEGVRRWKANPNNDTGYQYFKFDMLVTYSLETEKMTVDELFNKDIDRPSLEAKALASLH